MNRRTLILAGVSATVLAGRAAAQQGKAAVDALMTMPIDQLIAGIEAGGPEFMHPGTHYVLAQRLFFKENRKDEALFWFYTGQLRFRIHLGARPSIDKSGDPALFESFQETIGRPINLHAFADLDQVVATIDKALAWDLKHPDRFTPAEHYEEVRKQVRKGLEDFKADILKNREAIKAERTKNNLPNK